MKNLKEYNSEFAKKFKEYRKEKMSAGVLCPECNTELLYKNEQTGTMYWSYSVVHPIKPEPTKQIVICSICGFEGEKMKHHNIEMEEEKDE